MPKNDTDELSPEEVARRRDDALRRALAMPPQPQEELKVGRGQRSNPKQRHLNPAKEEKPSDVR
jgi:hypothetical protein